MHGQLLSKEQFDSFIEKNVRPALNVVGTNLQNPNKLNQVAARMLGFGTYEEKLQPFHKRESNIRESIHFELCPFQGNRPTFKAHNVIVVLDEAEQAIYARILRGGEEAHRNSRMGGHHPHRHPRIGKVGADILETQQPGERGEGRDIGNEPGRGHARRRRHHVLFRNPELVEPRRMPV